MTAEDEPTPEQCSAGAAVEIGGRHGIVMWWPQMGGYAAKAAVFAEDECAEILVWHDGNFPFSGHCPNCSTGRSPARIHVCDPGQWVKLGRDLAVAAERLRP